MHIPYFSFQVHSHSPPNESSHSLQQETYHSDDYFDVALHHTDGTSGGHFQSVNHTSSEARYTLLFSEISWHTNGESEIPCGIQIHRVLTLLPYPCSSTDSLLHNYKYAPVCWNKDTTPKADHLQEWCAKAKSVRHHQATKRCGQDADSQCCNLLPELFSTSGVAVLQNLLKYTFPRNLDIPSVCHCTWLRQLCFKSYSLLHLQSGIPAEVQKDLCPALAEG